MASRNNLMNLVVWGLGKHAINKVLPAIDKSENFSLYGVCSRDINSLKAIKDKYNVITWNSSSEMLSNKGIDAIYLATPPALHTEQAIKVLDKGIHLLCEKPITMSPKDTSLLIEKANQSTVVLLEGLMYKYHPHYQKLKSLLEKERLGKIKEMKVSFQLPTLEKPGYRKDPALGASAIYDLGIYPVSLVLGLFNPSQVELCKKSIIYDTNLDFDISGKAFLKIENDFDCIIDWSYDKTYVNEVFISGHSLSLNSKFIFSKDSTYSPIFKLRSDDGLVKNINVEEADHFELMLKSFFNSIKDPKDKLTEITSMLDLSIFLDRLAN